MTRMRPSFLQQPHKIQSMGHTSIDKDTFLGFSRPLLLLH